MTKKSSDDVVEESRMNVKIRVEKKFNVAAWEYEMYSLEIEAPYEQMTNAKDMIRLLLPVARNLKVVAVKAFKNEGVDTLPPTQPAEEPKIIETKKLNQNDDI